jgi:hypothetical protein
MTILTDDPD